MQSKAKISAWVKYLTLIIITLVTFGCDPDVSNQQLMQAAKTYLNQNKLREAALELRNVLQKSPNNAEARYLLGTINLNIGDTASAEKEFRHAANAGWQESAARIGQARAMLNSNAFQTMLDEIDIKDSYSTSSQADLYALRALAQAGLKNMNHAIKTLEKATEIDADSFHVLKSTIQIHMANNNIENANSSLEKALAMHPKNQEILFQMLQ